MSKRVLAFDFGASSGRAIIGSYENGKITYSFVISKAAADKTIKISIV